MSKKQKKMLTRIMAAAFGVILLNFVPVTGILRFTLYLAVYLVIGYDILKKAGRGILNRRMFDENFLMAVATNQNPNILSPNSPKCILRQFATGHWRWHSCLR